MTKKKLVTTSIPYINAEPHIGFLLELLATDVLARYYCLTGHEVFFLTGTDEHGLKVQQAAATAGQEPQVFADKITASYQQLARDFKISNDFFIRTTDPGHIQFVQEQWQKLVAAGTIEKRIYEGWYCSGCESFKTEHEIQDGRCALHQLELEKIKEENYFLQISPEAKNKIKGWINQSLWPESRRSEVLHSLEELDGVSVSRPREKLSWGIPVPGDEAQTMYVWTDALLNYLSGIKLSGRQIEDYWPGIQVIGKDIVKFHAIIWPTILLALGYELPEQLLVHGFVTINGEKISKSQGNVIYPHELIEHYGVEASRYLVLRQLSFYDDSNFVWSEFDALYDGELANGIGNLLARLVGLLPRWQFLPTEIQSLLDEEQSTEIKRTLPAIVEWEESSFNFHNLLDSVNQAVKEADSLITKYQLWQPRDDALPSREGFDPNDPDLDETTYRDMLKLALSNLIRVSFWLDLVIPDTAAEIRRQLTELVSKPLFPRLKRV